MPKVTLACHWNPGNAVHRPGDVVDVDDATAQWLQRAGAVAAPQAKRRKVAPEPSGSKPEAEAAAENPDDAPVVKRPARTAPLEEWRKYAKSQGYDTKGLTKQELIALQ